MGSTNVSISATVMTHPRRRAAAEAVQRSLPDLDITIVTDPEPDGPPTAWRTARRAWAAVGDDATHHLVLQDDVAVAPGFLDWLVQALATRPDSGVSPFVEWGSRTAHAVRVAALRGLAWAPVVDDYIPCNALVLPADVARGFDGYAARETTWQTPDDVALLGHLTQTGTRVAVPVRNVVQHDAVGSLVGNSTMGVRQSVSFAATIRSDPAGPALESLHQVPYYCWWDQQAALFVPDATTDDGWRRVRGREALLLNGTTPEALIAPLDEVLVEVADRAELFDTVSRIVIEEIWFTAFLLGATARQTGPTVALEPGTDAWDSLATLPQGALRRVVPTQRLDLVGALLAPVVIAGVQCGVHHVESTLS